MKYGKPIPIPSQGGPSTIAFHHYSAEVKRANEAEAQLVTLRATLAAKDRLLERMAGACRAINEAHGSMFAQCCSNPIFNTWGKEVDVSTLNEAHHLAESALKEYVGQKAPLTAEQEQRIIERETI